MFAQDFALELTLTINGTKYEIPCGHIKNFTVDIHNYGYTGELDFWFRDDYDEIYNDFIKNNLIEMKFTIQSYYNPEDTPADPIVLQGLISKKNFKEETFTWVDKDPISFRCYYIEFADAAQVLWKQHYPCELYVDKTIKDVIEDHKGTYMIMEYDWTPLTESQPVIFLGLGDSKNRASFYDLLIWYVATNNGIWNYDIENNKYQLKSEKDSSTAAGKLEKEFVESYKVSFPETPRHSVYIRNSYATTPKSEQITQDYDVTGITKDILIRTSITSIATAVKTLETNKLKIREAELDVTFKKFPNITYQPGTLIEYDTDDWGKNIFVYNKKYRVRNMSIKAKAAEQNPSLGEYKTFNGYNTEMTSNLELSTEEYIDLPEYITPHYPVYIEGKVVSETGSETEETYQVYTDSNSLNIYKVEVPLWENQKVIAPFEPNYYSSHFYFPRIKESRVLLEMTFLTARICRCLDWRTGANLPTDGQGNHILFGWSSENNNTSMQHVYTDSKPVFSIKRTLSNDTELLQFEEGNIIIQTKEEEG